VSLLEIASQVLVVVHSKTVLAWHLSLLEIASQVLVVVHSKTVLAWLMLLYYQVVISKLVQMDSKVARIYKI